MTARPCISEHEIRLCLGKRVYGGSPLDKMRCLLVLRYVQRDENGEIMCGGLHDISWIPIDESLGIATNDKCEDYLVEGNVRIVRYGHRGDCAVDGERG